MVARGDLGVELDLPEVRAACDATLSSASGRAFEQVPLAQKVIISHTKARGKVGLGAGKGLCCRSSRRRDWRAFTGGIACHHGNANAGEYDRKPRAHASRSVRRGLGGLRRHGCGQLPQRVSAADGLADKRVPSRRAQVMLSGESASGQFPVEAVSMVSFAALHRRSCTDRVALMCRCHACAWPPSATFHSRSGARAGFALNNVCFAPR
jgi:hypothetical protein